MSQPHQVGVALKLVLIQFMVELIIEEFSPISHRVEYERTIFFSSLDRALLFTTHIRLSKVQMLKLKGDEKEPYH